MAEDPIKQMPREAFDAWAAHMGIDTDPEHLDKLYPEAATLLRRMAAVHTIDTSEVDPAEASETVPRDMLQGESS
jgi:hypothetical protein